MPSALEPAFLARLDAVLAELATGGAPTAQRHDAARMLADAVRHAAPAPDWTDPLHRLATDADPAVRRVIALALPDLPDEVFSLLAARMADDQNQYVRDAVTKAIERRGRGQRQNRKMRKDVADFQARYLAFEKSFGARAARQARRMANQMFDVLVGGTLHDMDSILAPMRVDLETMRKHFQDGKPGRAACRGKVDHVARQVEYLQAFLCDMRDYARADDGKRSRVHIGDLMRRALVMARDGVQAAGVDTTAVAVIVEVPEALRAALYARQATTALMHLLRNGLETLADATVAGEKRLTVRAQSDGIGGVLIVVTDNGPGIGPKVLQELLAFAPGKTTRRRRGTGFGLPTAHRFAEAHGGRLEIESQPGLGAVFTLVLPAQEEPDE